MTELTARVITRVLEEAQRPLGIKELLRLAGLHPGEQTAVKRLLRDLLKTGQIEKEGKRFQLPGAPVRPAREARAPKGRASAVRGGGGRGQIVEGELHIHRDGFGFVHPSSGEGENVFVPVVEARKALDHDRVRVRVEPSGRDGRTAGRLMEVISRRREQVVGTYVERGRQAFVEANDPGIPDPIRVPRTQLARDGDLVKVQLGVGAELLEPGEGLTGEVSGSLGRPGTSSGEVLSIVFSQGFRDEFPPEVMAESDGVPLQVSEAEATQPGRRDLRKLPLVTIDGADARDFDDAVYAERTARGYRLVVAIADVSHYVRSGEPLDREALARGTSVYLPDRVLPMLPERLSAGICSLRPDEDRMCMVADMELDRSGRLGTYTIYPGVMRSVARCTYDEVQAVLDGEDVPHRNAFKPHFELLMELARTLNKMRQGRGAIDFDLPEVRIVLDEQGVPVRMAQRPRKDAHRLVEECMLAANEAVAKFFQDRGLPSVYRYHGDPDEEKLEIFAALARAHGFAFQSGEELTSKVLADFVRTLEGHPEQRALNQLLLRSMMQAVYSAEDVGHYGLGAEHYLHFTSPIRRYPDLLVHRLLKAHWARGEDRSPPDAERETAKLQAMAEQSSDRERAAMQVEREVTAFYAALLMKDRVGEEFAATVSSVTDFGLFVELDEEHVEGLIRAETIGHGSRLDTALHALVFPGTGRKVRVGQKLRVRLTNVSLERRQLEMELVAFEGEEAVPPRAREEVRRGAQRGAQKQKRWAPGPERRGPPPREAPVVVAAEEDDDEASQPAAVKHAEPVVETPAEHGHGSSPHPGFDRLRALAAMKGRGAKAAGASPKRGAEAGTPRSFGKSGKFGARGEGAPSRFAARGEGKAGKYAEGAPSRFAARGEGKAGKFAARGEGAASRFGARGEGAGGKDSGFDSRGGTISSVSGVRPSGGHRGEDARGTSRKSGGKPGGGKPGPRGGPSRTGKGKPGRNKGR